MPIILAFALVPAVLAALDSAVRAALVLRSRSASRAFRGAFRGEHPRRWLIIIPSRAEGARLRATLESVTSAARAPEATTLLLLDGDDAEAAAAGRALGVEVHVKTPAGPTKAAALAWLAREHQAVIEAADAILVIDAGSTIAPDFFDRFLWPEDADAVQAYLSGVADANAGAGAAMSERFAQAQEDRGREAFGWNVRLRGTGSAFRPRTFIDVIPRLATRIEDHEASILLTAAGATIRLAPPDAVVFDEKPASVRAAASQRARWLLGRYELLARRSGAFVTIAARRPAEGLAAIVEIFGRPLSLTIPLRLITGAFAIRSGSVVLGSLVAGSTAIDIVSHLTTARGVPRGAASVAASWLLALILAPRALTRWLRTER